MADVEIKVNMGRASGLMAKLAKNQGFRTGARAAFVHLKSRIARYPSRSSRPQAQYWTPKQRKGFFYHLRNGDIDVPYKRGTSPNSERLAQSWVVEGEGLETTLRNNASYYKYTHGEKQTAYHKATGWKKTQVVIAEEQPQMARIIRTAVAKDLV